NNSVMNCILRAGGPSYKALESQVQVIRADAGPNERPIRVDMRAVLRYGKVQKDPGVRPGDIVYVPSKFITLADTLSLLANINALRFYLGQ
ncbi:MAG: hypothetical protein QHJ73_19975, partial [Armatimonadota bacterium]|nr:hypothetical protein [Armatimonadota bacterium]